MTRQKETPSPLAGEGIELDPTFDKKGKLSVNTSIPKEKEVLGTLDLSAIQKEVSFSDIFVRTYPIVPGDNPACTDGLPLAIDWEYLNEYNFTVDYYERKLEKWSSSPSSPVNEAKYPRKTEDELRISAMDRLQLLQTAGFPLEQLKKDTRIVNRDRNNRDRTLKSMRLDNFFYSWECLQRALLNGTFRRSTKRKERELLKPYRKVTASTESFRKRGFSIFSIFRKTYDSNNPSKFMVLEEKYSAGDTESEGMSLQPTPLSYNGDALFPPTPTPTRATSPLSKTINETDEPKSASNTVDMTGRVRPPISNLKTRRNKRVLWDDDQEAYF